MTLEMNIFNIYKQPGDDNNLQEVDFIEKLVHDQFQTTSSETKIDELPFRWWPSGESLGPRGLLPLWSQVQTLGCSYDGHWRLTWSLTSGPLGLIEVHASWPGHPR